MTTFRDLLEFLLFQGIKSLFFFLPRKICLILGQILGFVIYALDKKHRQIALRNLKIAFAPQLSDTALNKIALNSFLHFGLVLADILKLFSLGKEKKKKLISAEGEDNLRKALGEGKGALLFTAHYGNWEIASFFISRFRKLWVIARPLDNKLFEKELAKLRASLGAIVIYKQQATKQILQALRRGEMVALLIDQNVLRSQAVFIDFFGKKAATTPSLASFFLRTKAPIIPVFCSLTPSLTYHLKILKPLEISLEGNYEQDVLKITEISTKIIENEIRQNPSYWLWFHQRWKTRPEREVE